MTKVTLSQSTTRDQSAQVLSTLEIRSFYLMGPSNDPRTRCKRARHQGSIQTGGDRPLRHCRDRPRRIAAPRPLSGSPRVSQDSPSVLGQHRCVLQPDAPCPSFSGRESRAQRAGHCSGGRARTGWWPTAPPASLWGSHPGFPPAGVGREGNRSCAPICSHTTTPEPKSTLPPPPPREPSSQGPPGLWGGLRGSKRGAICLLRDEALSLGVEGGGASHHWVTPQTHVAPQLHQ